MIDVEPSLRDVVRVGALRLDGVRVEERAGGAAPDLPSETPALEARVSAVRQMYRRLGLDPTKVRPSSEALLRRLRKGQPWPRINTLVDAVNAASVSQQLPYGLYDAGRIHGAVVLRRGAPGDEYAGIRKTVVHLDGRPALCDARGPFGNPTSDSARTMVTPATTEALLVVYAPPGIDDATIDRCLDETSSRLRDAAGGRETARCLDTAPGPSGETA